MAVPAEPVVSLTDVALGLASLWFAVGTRRSRLWCSGFAAAAAAAFAGAVYHGSAAGQSPVVHGVLWEAILTLIGLSGVLIAAAALRRQLPRGAARTGWIEWGAGVSAAALGVQQSRLHWGAFDHNSLFHLLEIAALYLFYRAARGDAAQARLPSS